LAFSAGVDSTALFFTLLEYGVDFDIAIVNYHTRIESEHEVAYAKELASKYHKELYTNDAPAIKHNFEHHARTLRYDFFETIIIAKEYTTLITAHQLDDRFEWLLMQLSKGAGAAELIGFSQIETRRNYQLIRPFYKTSRQEILAFLKINAIHHFIDASNSDRAFKRNHIRESYAGAFLKEYGEGVKRSLDFLETDRAILTDFTILRYKELRIIPRNTHPTTDLRAIDKVFKESGHLLSLAQKDEIMKSREVVIADMAIVIDKQNIYIAPFIQQTMEKDFKEKCRILKVPKKIRPYLFLKLKEQTATIFNYK
jgi:tRNA(Ile)-lysidine synthase